MQAKVLKLTKDFFNGFGNKTCTKTALICFIKNTSPLDK